MISFAAHYAGTPPAPFRPFDAGEIVFYLVGVDQGNGQPPAPGVQLDIQTATDKGTGRDPVDRCTETARGWRGRRRVVVATRSYSWARYERGAKATARDAAVWTGRDGNAVRVWSYVVAVDDAASLGYRVPNVVGNSWRGNRNVGHENNAEAVVVGNRIAPRAEPVRQEPAAQPEPAPVAVEAEPVAAPLRAAGLRVTEDRMERARRIAQRNRGDAAPEPRTDLGVARFAALDLSSAPVAVAVPEEDENDPGAARFAALDLD